MSEVLEPLEQSKTKILAVLQPGYLAWLGFFDQLNRSDVFVIYDDVQYDKNGWRNRNRVKSATGPVWLTVPVVVEHLHQKLNTVKIDNGKNWSRKHLQTIKQLYQKAPFFENYYSGLVDILTYPWEYIAELDKALIKQIVSWLEINTHVVCSSELSIEGERSERLLKFCQQFNATCYLSGNAAQCYLDTEIFTRENIEVKWQNYSHPTYHQLYGEFVPYLSVIDLLFNCGPHSLNIITNKQMV